MIQLDCELIDGVSESLHLHGEAFLGLVLAQLHVRPGEVWRKEQELCMKEQELWRKEQELWRKEQELASPVGPVL